jgi:quinol-cytochrome oxidoreductase complex cytochrome b subunit
MYSMIDFPPSVKRVVMKPSYRSGLLSSETLSCGQVCTDTWFVWEIETGIVQAIYYMKPNQHGWSASESHAKSHVNRSHAIHPFELDSIS